jgi:hypothetical protein
MEIPTGLDGMVSTLRRLSTSDRSRERILVVLNELEERPLATVDSADDAEISALTGHTSAGPFSITETQALEGEAQVHKEVVEDVSDFVAQIQEGVVGNVLDLTGPTSAGPFSITETQAPAVVAQIHKGVVEDVSDLVTVDLGSTKG